MFMYTEASAQSLMWFLLFAFFAFFLHICVVFAFCFAFFACFARWKRNGHELPSTVACNLLITIPNVLFAFFAFFACFHFVLNSSFYICSEFLCILLCIFCMFCTFCTLETKWTRTTLNRCLQAPLLPEATHYDVQYNSMIVSRSCSCS